MKILLINPPCGPRTIGMRHIARIEPLGLEQIGAGVSKDHEVRLVDMQVRPDDLERTLHEFRPDVAGATTETVRVGPAIETLRTVKASAPNCTTVIGGHHPTVFPEDFNDPAIDLIAVGEGYYTFREICETKQSGSDDYSHIAGLVLRTPDGLIATAERPMLTNLDELPVPDRSLTAQYRKMYYYLLEPSAAAMRTSYGCKSNCSFCPGALVYGRSYIARDPQAMFDEICSIKEPFIMFADNGSFHDAETMGKLGEMLLSAGIKKRYYTYTRADAVVQNPDLFELWGKVGLSMAFIGIEALTDKALELLNKGVAFSKMEKAIEILDRVKVPITAGFVIAPDATRDDFDRIDRFIAAHPTIIHAEFTPLTPFSGTRFYEEVKDTLITNDWELWDLQHFVVKTVMEPKELYRLMMRSYRKIVLRVTWREGLWMPIRGLRQRKWHVLRGLLINGKALKHAHTHVGNGESEDGVYYERIPAPRRLQNIETRQEQRGEAIVK